MDRSGTESLDLVLGVVFAFVLTVLCLGRASTAPPMPDESALTAAGCKTVVAKTTQQQEHLQSLPAGKLTELQRNGTHFFVYPDPAKNQIYVGTQKEYEAYRRVHPTDTSTLAKQQAADMASYNKQDDAMRTATNRDLSDPYYFWPSFGILGW